MTESVLTVFEAAWQAGQRPDIAEFLVDRTNDARLTEELAQIDLDYRLRQNEAVRVEQYLEQFSLLRENDDAIVRLAVAEFRLNRHLGQEPSESDLLSRFPHQADAIRAKLRAMETAEIEQDSGTGPSRTAPEVAAATQPNDWIGPYRILEIIGEGGMGTVFLAEQQEPIRRRVALKVIKPGMDSLEILRRFEAERKALALMDHPNIARVLDAGVGASGQSYFAMELVTGESITQYCRENRVPLKDRLDLFIQACEAIQHAHQKGIIHRDIKPSNVLVTIQAGRPAVKVIDFGLAKALQSECRLSDGTHYTQLGQILGTFQYMSPEQAGANPLDVDTRADVYSLGVVLYELLAGTTPIERERLDELAIDLLLRAIREEQPPRPSTRLSSNEDSAVDMARQLALGLPELADTLQGDLDWIVMKAIEKDRLRRYETPSEFAADVRRFLSNDTVTARPPSIGYQLGKAVQRHRTAVLVSVAFVLTLIVATGVSIAFAFHAKHMAEQADFHKGQAEGELREKLARERELIRALDWGFAVVESQFNGNDDPIKAVMRRRSAGNEMSMSDATIEARSEVLTAAGLFFQLSGDNEKDTQTKIQQVLDADRHLSNAIRLDSSIGLAFLSRAELWNQARDFARGDALKMLALKAIAPAESRTSEDWEKAVKLMPGSSLALSGRGYWVKHSDRTAAVEDWQRAVEFDATNDLALLGLGDHYYEQEDWREAMPYYLKAFADRSSVARLLYPEGFHEQNAKIGALNASMKIFNQTRDRQERLRSLAVLWMTAIDVPGIDEGTPGFIWKEVQLAILNDDNVDVLSEILAGMADLPDVRSFHLTRCAMQSVCHIFLGRELSSFELDLIGDLADSQTCEISAEDFDLLRQSCIQRRGADQAAGINSSFDSLLQALTMTK